jgi:cutinase
MITQAILLTSLALGAISFRIEPRQECNPMLANDMEHGSMDMAVAMKPSDIRTGCSDFEVLVGKRVTCSAIESIADTSTARGMGESNSEPSGKFGMIVGYPLIGNVTALIPGARGYPVQYPASTNVAEDEIRGRTDIINRLMMQSAACPNQKFALAGYSQGAIVIHAAATRIPRNVLPKVLAVVLFGDPTKTSPKGVEKVPDALYQRLQENCSKGDHTCDTSKGCHSDHARHMDYVKQPWIDRGAKFIAAAFQGKQMQAEIGETLSL